MRKNYYNFFFLYNVLFKVIEDVYQEIILFTWLIGEEEFEMEEESRDRTAVSGSGDEEVSGGVNTEEIEHDEEEDEEFLDVEMNEKSWWKFH